SPNIKIPIKQYRMPIACHVQRHYGPDDSPLLRMGKSAHGQQFLKTLQYKTSKYARYVILL
ncbi:hypothetical protein, partial [Acetobacter syzygii]|uniref:hypothetical protein n=1 Tax=Acetobacter syzygii TaxID=146476 RepID=UPI001C5293A6